MKKSNSLSAVMAAAALTACAFSLPSMAQTGNQQTRSQDKKFVMEAAQGGLAEVEFGKIASMRAKDPEVKSFGQQMVTDHTMLNTKMKPDAKKLGVPPPMRLNAEHAAEARKLRSLSGDDFDKEYVSNMVKDHHHDVDEFQHEVDTTQNMALKAKVQEGLEVVKQHTEMIDGIAKKMSISTP